MLELEPVKRDSRLRTPEERTCRLRHELQIPVAMPRECLFRLPSVERALAREPTHRLEQPVAVGLVVHERLLDESRDVIENLVLLDTGSGADDLGRLEREGARENRQTP